MKTFEDYLYDYYVDNESEGVLDDDLNDAFEDWLVTRDGEDYIRLGNAYGLYLQDIVKDTLNNI